MRWHLLGSITKSTMAAAALLVAMPLSRSSGRCSARVRPPRSFTAVAPRVPSLPVPSRMTATARSFWSSARETRKLSIEPRSAESASAAATLKQPPRTASRVPASAR
jgi:hypothetical protein